MPEIAPSPLEGRTIDRSLLERPMVPQAWGAYGTAWRVRRPVLRLTHRGLEVLARVTGNKRGRHVLVVRTR